jgi:GH15 family glucan-1,4-alpha-glucosidase
MLQKTLLANLERRWREPDEGIWEVRGPRRHFTHSKVMAWVAFDRGIKAIEQFGHEGPLERWKGIRAEIHAEVLERGFDEELNAFVQSYDSTELDASLLTIPLVGFLPPEDPRVQGTFEAIQRELFADGFVSRYRHDETPVDGLPPGEGAFFLCSFWFVDNLALAGRVDEAVELFERLLALRNELGLLSEEYDPGLERLVGNFPQAFSHIGLIATAMTLERALARGGD